MSEQWIQKTILRSLSLSHVTHTFHINDVIQTRFHQNISKIRGGRTRTQRGGGDVRFRKFSKILGVVWVYM